MGTGAWRSRRGRLDRFAHPHASGLAPQAWGWARHARHAFSFIVDFARQQRTHIVRVTEAYERRCAMTGERTLPVLHAAHVRPYSLAGEHRLDNGLLLRSDLHTLLDQGYLTIGPDDRRIVVSKRIREEFENGHTYYALHGARIADPVKPEYALSQVNLLYHAPCVFRS